MASKLYDVAFSGLLMLARKIEGGVGKQDNKISIEMFQMWLRVSLDIRGFSYPCHIIETNAGDLILDPNFHGQLYLKGMLLPAAFCELKTYRLGYNFPRGKVNRDRQILVDSHEEANIVRQIWEAALQNHKEKLLPIYIDLLRNYHDAPDVGFAKDLLESPQESLFGSIFWTKLREDISTIVKLPMLRLVASEPFCLIRH
jgi:hypothetical protein